jgi:ABC-type Mn2+/Zn2+ transport system permease subunit
VRLVARSVRALLAGSVALAAAEGLAGVYVALWANAAPGPAIALLGGTLFALAAAVRR